MRQSFMAALVTGLLVTSASAQEPLALRDMGSFHVGGRKVEVTGQPVKEIQRVPGGPMSKLDLNGTYHVERMYAQYFLVQNRKGKFPLLMWHGGGLTGATYETTPDGREGWRDMMIRRGWDVYITDATERGRSGFASPLIWKDDPVFLTEVDPWERFRIGTGPGLVQCRSGQAQAAARQPVPDRGLRHVPEADRAALAVDRQGHHRRLCGADRQGLPVRDPRAQPGRPLCLPRRRAAPRQGQGHGLGRAGDRAAAAAPPGGEGHAAAARLRRLHRAGPALGRLPQGGARPMPTPCARPAARPTW